MLNKQQRVWKDAEKSDGYDDGPSIDGKKMTLWKNNSKIYEFKNEKKTSHWFSISSNTQFNTCESKFL